MNDQSENGATQASMRRVAEASVALSHAAPPRTIAPPVTNHPPRPRPTERPANSGMTQDQTIRHVALTHTTHYYRDQDPAPTTAEVLKTAAIFAAWIKDGRQ